MLEARYSAEYRLVAIRFQSRMPAFNNDFKYFYLSENLTL